MSTGIGLLGTPMFNAEPVKRWIERDGQIWTWERVECAAHQARMRSV